MEYNELIHGEYYSMDFDHVILVIKKGFPCDRETGISIFNHNNCESLQNIVGRDCFAIEYEYRQATEDEIYYWNYFSTSKEKRLPLDKIQSPYKLVSNYEI